MISLALALAAFGEPPCGDASVSHAERMACAAELLRASDTQLKMAWRRYDLAMRSAADRSPDGGTWAPVTEQSEKLLGRRYFDASQRARKQFYAFRDAQCVSEGFPLRGGSGSEDPIIKCKIALDEAQSARLAAAAKEIR